MASSAALSPVKLARLFASTWLANLMICPGPVVEGARRHDDNNNNRRSRHPPSSSSSSSNRRPNNGFSPNYDIYDDNDLYYSKSFYERNGLTPPPLVSRSAVRRRAQQSDPTTDGDNTTELDLIVQEAKSGTDPATLLRKDIIKNGNYDRHAYPWDYAWHGQEEGTRTGTPVEFQLNFHRVFSVDIINPVLDMIVWMRIEWSDPRLTWKPEEYGNLTKTWFWIGDGGAGGETSEIWTPDIELWNLEEGLKGSFHDAYAVVQHDGSIFWSRPGHLRPACKFYGLDNFPFDQLTCTMEFGSWGYSGKYMRLVKGGGTGYSMGGSETAGESFNEFSFVEDDPVQCIEHLYPPFAGSPEEDWPVLMYNVTIARSWQPYVRGYITMQVLLNIIGFSAFWLPPTCGERMGLSITAMLAAVAAEIVVAANLPAAAEYTWFQKFSLLSMAFAFVSLLESVAVLYFYYKRSETMKPWWYITVRKWYKSLRKTSQKVSETSRRTTHLVSETSNNIHRKVDGIVEGMKKRNSDPTNDDDNANDPKYDDEDSFSENFIGQVASPNEDSSVDLFVEDSKDKVGDGDAIDLYDRDFGVVETGKTLHDSEKRAEKRVGREGGDGDSIDLSDRDFVGVVETGKTFGASYISNLSFDGLADSEDKLNELKSSRIDRRGVRRGQSKKVKFSEVGDGELSQQSVEQRRPDEKISQQSVEQPSPPSRRASMENFRETQSAGSLRSMLVPRDADDFNNEEEVEHNRHWKNTAARIDDVARFWIPLAFFISLSIILSQAM